MKQVYRLTQRVTKPGSVVRSYHCRLADDEGNTVLEGATRNGIPSKLWQFSDATGAQAMSFGPNRKMLANRYIVCDQDHARLATIRLPMVNATFGGNCYDVDDQSGAPFMSLTSAANVAHDTTDGNSPWDNDQLVLVKDGEVLGYTGAEPEDVDMRNAAPAAGTASGVFGFASELSGLVIESIKDEFGDSRRVHKERVVSRLTLIDAGTDLDPRFVMGVLLFKSHVFESIRDVS